MFKVANILDVENDLHLELPFYRYSRIAFYLTSIFSVVNKNMLSRLLANHH